MPVAANAADVGSWSDVFDWPIIGIHVALTPDGKILTFGTDQNGAQTGLHLFDIWDPTTGEHMTMTHETNVDIFCAVVEIDPKTGEMIIMGGDGRPQGDMNGGVADVTVYDYTTMELVESSTGPLNYPRWYGSAVTTGAGQIVIMGGRDSNLASTGITYSPYVEIYTSGYGFRTLSGAYIDDFNKDSLYPRTWLASSGLIWTIDQVTGHIYAVSTEGNGSATLIGTLPTAMGWQLPAVMFAPDKVLMVANNGTAWILDMSSGAPVFTQTADAGTDRVWANLTVLPDGRVMMSGGSSVDNQLVNVETTVEIWDPKTGVWSTEADAAVTRLYHSSAILLQDGTVLTLGGGAPGPYSNLNGEIYSPDYLFDAGGVVAPRPVITAAPADLDVGDVFNVTVTGTAQVVTLALMKYGSVTHSLDFSSQRIEVPFTVQANGTLLADLPDNANVLTPGYWMLFAIDANGSVSVASTIEIHSELATKDILQDPLDLGVKLVHNGQAAYDLYDDTYTLVPNAAGKAGSVMSTERLDLSKAFTLSFDLNMGNNDNGADGASFILHNDADGSDALGTAADGFGALGIDNGLAIQFDTYYNAGRANELVADHTAFFNTATGADITTAVALGNLENGAWHRVVVTWTGTTLSYTVDGIAGGTLTAAQVSAALGGSQYAYFGFGGGTGGATEWQRVQIVSMTGTLEDGHAINADRADLARTPTFVTAGTTTYTAATDKYSLTHDKQLEAGGVFTSERIDLTKSFSFTFHFNVGDKDGAGADGLAFVLHNSPLGNTALGGLGGGLGAMNIANGLAIEFDTFQGVGDIANDHTGFIDTDAPAATNAVTASTDLGNIEDGNWHQVRVTWNGSAMSYYLDGVLVQTLTANIVAQYLGGSNYAYLGLTAATGGLTQQADVVIDRLDATAENGGVLHLVGPNSAPEAVDDLYVVTAGGTLTVSAANGVLANDTDPDGDALDVCEVPRWATGGHSHAADFVPQNGTLTINADGSFVYTPNAGFVGVDTFGYCVEDAWACAEGHVTVTVSGGSSQAVGFVTNGQATAGTGIFTVTPDAALQTGSVMSATRISLATAFSISFQINLGTKDGAGADGMAFVLHNDAAGVNAIGAAGGGLGANGINNAVAIEFDTFQGTGELANDHTSIFNPMTGALLTTAKDLGNIEDGAWHTVLVTWDGTTLGYSIDGTAIGSYAGVAGLIGSQSAYFGVTGATGGLTNLQQVRFLGVSAVSETGVELSLAGSTGTTSTYTQLVGDANANVIVGTDGADYISGLGGADTLSGGAGNDVISGGAGVDTMAGGAGNDIFVFAPGFGTDTITDFGDDVAGNNDAIDFSAFGLTALEVLAHSGGNADNDAVFDFGNGDVLIVKNMAASYVSNLTAGDFIV